MTNAETTISEIEQKKQPDAVQLDVSFFNSRQKKHVRLLDGDGSYKVKDNNECEFILKEEQYVSFVCITSSEDLDKKLIFKYLKDGGYISKKATSKEDKGGSTRYNFYVGKIIKGFSLRSDTVYLIPQNPVISKIEVFGVSHDDLIACENAFTSFSAKKTAAIDEIKRKIDEINKKQKELEDSQSSHEAAVSELREEKTSLSNEISELRSEISAYESQTASLKEASERLAKDNEKAESSLASLNKEIETKQAFKSEKESEIRSLLEKTNALKEQLRELNANKHLFTDELSSYSEQGNQNVRLYAFLSLIPILLMAMIAIRLFWNAEAIALTLNTIDIAGALALLLSRIPYAFISVSIIIFSFKITRILFSRVFEIHKERLVLSELAIIAKETSTAAARDLNLSDEELYDLRIRQKMDFIKRHLATRIETSSEFGPYAARTNPRHPQKQKESQEEHEDDGDILDSVE